MGPFLLICALFALRVTLIYSDLKNRVYNLKETSIVFGLATHLAAAYNAK